MTEIGYSNVFHVTIGGKPLTPDVARRLVGGWVDFGAGVPGAFQLTFRDEKKMVLAASGAEIGKPVVLAPVADGKGAQSPLLTGEITGLETDYDGTGTFTVVRGYDPGHRMLRQRRVAAYSNVSAADIARRLAAQDKLAIGSVGATKTVYEFISQGNVTDWDFLCRLADENDMVMFLDSDGKFHFEKPDPASGAPALSTPSDKSPFVLEAGVDILRCRAAVTAADQVTRTAARGWDVLTKRTLLETSQADSNPGIRIGTTPRDTTKKFGAATLVETHTPYDKTAQVEKAAASLADDVTSAFAELEVTVRGNPRLRPGIPVALTDVGEPFEGKYTVTAARHTFGDNLHYETFLTVSGRQWRSLYGLTSGGAQTAPRLPSVANALVTDIKDPKRQGRVKLQFPWLDDDYVSDWTRTVQFGGVDGGGVITPDVKDEVLVAFDRGALDHPYVIGGLYNGRDKPGIVDVPIVDPTRGKTVRRTLADRSGDRLDLLDQRVGKRGVRLMTGDNRLTINMDRASTEITIDSKGAVTISGATSVSVEAGRDLSLKAGGKLSIHSDGLVDIQGQAISARTLAGPFSVNAKTELSLTSTGGTTVTGEMVNLTGTGMVTVSSVATVQVSAGLDINIKSAKVDLFGAVTANTLPVV